MSEALIRTCQTCGKKNRIPPRHLHQKGTCGACKAALPPLKKPLDVDAQDFDAIVKDAPVPILVDFWAAWCGPCRLSAPEVDKVAVEMAGKALVLKVDTESHPELGARYGVRAIPNFLILRGGRVVRQQPGLIDHRQMRSWLEQAA